MSMLTVRRLRELLSYDAASGIFRWKMSTSVRHCEGSIAGSKGHHCYMRICIYGKRYYAHHLAWFFSYGRWPTEEIDHLDGDPLNNRLSNLREASHSSNMQNIRKAKMGNKIGLLGVSSRNSKFGARITIARRELHLGVFATPQQAHQAYLAAKRRLHQGNML